MSDLDALAQAAKDALAAAEQRGWDNAVEYIQSALDEKGDHCIVIMSGDKEATVGIEINDDNRNVIIYTGRWLVSDVIYEQYPSCKESTIDIRAGIQRSLEKVDKIVDNWGKVLA